MSPQSSLLPQVKELVLSQGFPMRKRFLLKQMLYLSEDLNKKSEYSEDDHGDDEEVDWIYSNEDDEKNDDDEDEEMTNAEVKESGNGNEEITDAEKTDAKKTEEVNDNAKKAELPPSSSSLSVSSDVEINSLLDIKIQSEVPHIQPPPVLTVPISVISEPSVLTPIPKTPLVAPTITLLPPLFFSTIPPVLLQTTTPIPTPPITTEAPTITTVVPESDALIVVQLRVAKFEKDVSKLKKIDHSTDDLAFLKSQVPTVKYSMKPVLKPSKIHTSTSNLEPESEKSASEIRKIKKEQAEKQKMPKVFARPALAFFNYQKRLKADNHGGSFVVNISLLSKPMLILYGAFIVNEYLGIHEVVTIIQHLILNPEYLFTRDSEKEESLEPQTTLSYKMSQPANDEFSQHLSDDEESNHEDASDTGNAPKQQQQVIPQTTAISNIKLPILKKEEYDIWAMEMEHYLEYIDNEVWKVIQNGNSKKRIS
ncbi:hypothetical protein Tco_1219680 [Tanacetum coccineum]